MKHFNQLPPQRIRERPIMKANINIYALGLFVLFSAVSCGQNSTKQSEKKMENQDMAGMQVATFGAGCFWCVEAVFQRLKGVVKIESGYEGGSLKNPSYKDVCTGLTGHAEACRITYDPKRITYEELLEVFWKTHDPTTLNRQGADSGTQYRSVVFYHNDEQKQLAEYWKDKLNKEKVFPNPIVTEISPSSTFYVAEDYHQDYFNQNGYAPYCQIVIKPKVDKFLKAFKDKLNKEQ